MNDNGYGRTAPATPGVLKTGGVMGIHIIKCGLWISDMFSEVTWCGLCSFKSLCNSPSRFIGIKGNKLHCKLYCTAFRLNALYCTAHTQLYGTSLNYTVLHCTVLHYYALHCTDMPSFHWSSSQGTTD